MITKLPPSLVPREISLGYSGITLYASDDLHEAQLGYSRLPDGTSLTGQDPGDWREEWVVIGNEQTCGDPIFVDTSGKLLPVFTAMHGVGSWDPRMVAESYEGFLRIIERFSKVAIGREHPVALEAKPMTRVEFDEFMAFASVHSGADDNTFWGLLVSDQEAGIGPDNC